MIPLGKYRRLCRLSTQDGRFEILAIDQRDSLRRLIAQRQEGISPDSVGAESLRLVKRSVTAALAPLASAILTDPLFGYPATIRILPPSTGVLLALEKTSYETYGRNERRSRLLDNWNVERLLQCGADAVKLLVWHHPEASAATQRHQEALVEKVGEACAHARAPFVLEVITYAPSSADPRGAVHARHLPDLVAHAASTFSAPHFRVDVLKLQFPASLKHTEEYQESSFAAGDVVYDLAHVREACAALNEAASVPWVILSAGVDAREFVEMVRLANEAGSSGFLGGRAIWKRVLDAYPDASLMDSFMLHTGRPLFEKLCTENKKARPWHEHPHFRDHLPRSVPSKKE